MNKLHNMHYMFSYDDPVNGGKCDLYRFDEGYYYLTTMDNCTEFHYVCSLDNDVQECLSDMYF